MKIPDSLPWEYDSESGFIEANDSPMFPSGDNQVICQFFSKNEHVFFGCDANAEYIIKAANMLPELLKALEAVTERYTSLINSGDCGNWDPEEEPEIMQVRELLAKVKED